MGWNKLSVPKQRQYHWGLEINFVGGEDGVKGGCVKLIGLLQVIRFTESRCSIIILIVNAMMWMIGEIMPRFIQTKSLASFCANTNPYIKINSADKGFNLYKAMEYVAEYNSKPGTFLWSHKITTRGPLNIKISSYQYRDPHVKDKTGSRPSYL